MEVVTMNGPPRPAPNRRQVLKGLGVLTGAATLTWTGVLIWRTSSEPGSPATPSSGGAGTPTLDELGGMITSGGPGKDGIPSIDQPQFVPPEQAGFLSDDEPVFGLDYRGDVRAYPQQVLVWHEIVNDTVAEEPLTVTYCPLTGTVIGFTSPRGQPRTFGTTGNLVNSNLLMYDRQTDSEWPQILGTAIRGPDKGRRLSTVPLVWTTWKAWRSKHPDTRVLSTETGALRNYGTDPYGSYTPRSGYYAEDGLYFSVQHTDDRFQSKDVVVGIRANGKQVAIPKDLVRRRSTVEARVGDTAVIARWDDALGTVHVVDSNTDQSADFLDSMWFAWYTFYPDSTVMT
jgi:hypothetical protein